MGKPLITNRVCFLLGAGASVPAGLPTMPQMGLGFFGTSSLPDLRGFLESMDKEMPSYDPHWSPNDRNVEWKVCCAPSSRNRNLRVNRNHLAQRRTLFAQQLLFRCGEFFELWDISGGMTRRS